jgi:crossover junction endodeoxyribonuclease RuvC
MPGIPRRDGATAPRVVIGVDPGLASVGYGVLRAADGSIRRLDHGCIETASGQPMEIRLQAIYAGVSDVLARWRPDAGGIETLFFFRNVSSALPVAEARGVIRLAFLHAAVPLSEFTPNAIKKAVTGTARADKAQVQEMVRILLGLRDIPKPDHAADALAAAICAVHNEGAIADIPEA